ncbi:hypothetical protein C8R47DRAFT_1075542 [Mycena vitilis]|nr:hypothetical protein C8R47DRAFT_1075542 [Mycena vitilis]
MSEVGYDSVHDSRAQAGPVLQCGAPVGSGHSFSKRRSEILNAVPEPIESGIRCACISISITQRTKPSGCRFKVEHWGTLGDAKPHEDFVPTRDSSSPEGCVFSYKYTNMEVGGNSVLRGRIPLYNPCIFGEVAGVHRENGLRVKLMCPREVDDDGRRAYRRQLHTLEKLMEIERCDQDGEIRSWFGSSGTLAGDDESFSVHVSPKDVDMVNNKDLAVGLSVAAWIYLRRVDKEQGRLTHKTYRLDVAFFVRVTPFHYSS